MQACRLHKVACTTCVQPKRHVDLSQNVAAGMTVALLEGQSARLAPCWPATAADQSLSLPGCELQAFTPTSVYLNGRQCSLNLTVNVSALVPGIPIPANFSLAEAAGFISVVNGAIVGTDGRPVTLRGANWFGFDTQVWSFSLGLVIDRLGQCMIVRTECRAD